MRPPQSNYPPYLLGSSVDDFVGSSFCNLGDLIVPRDFERRGNFSSLQLFDDDAIECFTTSSSKSGKQDSQPIPHLEEVNFVALCEILTNLTQHVVTNVVSYEEKVVLNPLRGNFRLKGRRHTVSVDGSLRDFYRRDNRVSGANRDVTTNSCGSVSRVDALYFDNP
jgi:hypothetical protein